MAVFAIETGEYLRGYLSPQDERAVRDWYERTDANRLMESWYAFQTS